MKIYLDKYDPAWPAIFNDIKSELENILRNFNPIIEHIGSTSIPGMTAKPIIDILVGLTDENDFEATVNALINEGYIFYEKYNSVMPYRRFFVKLKSIPVSFPVQKIYYENDEVPNELNDFKSAHIHVLRYNSFHWIRHTAFRDYLMMHHALRIEYEELKMKLSRREWRDANEYNFSKNEFIKRVEGLAMEWYKKRNSF